MNLCRFLAFLQDDLYLSKETGGQWGMINLDKKYHVIILQAMNCYETNQEYKIDKILEEQFVNKMLLEITNEIKKFGGNDEVV